MNHLKGLRIVFEKEELNVKILKSLNRTWQPKVMTISKSKNLSFLTHVKLLGKLREYGMDVTSMVEEEAK